MEELIQQLLMQRASTPSKKPSVDTTDGPESRAQRAGDLMGRDFIPEARDFEGVTPQTLGLAMQRGLDVKTARNDYDAQQKQNERIMAALLQNGSPEDARRFNWEWHEQSEEATGANEGRVQMADPEYNVGPAGLDPYADTVERKLQTITPGSAEDPYLQTAGGQMDDAVELTGWIPTDFADLSHGSGAQLLAGQLTARRRKTLGLLDPAFQALQPLY